MGEERNVLVINAELSKEAVEDILKEEEVLFYKNTLSYSELKEQGFNEVADNEIDRAKALFGFTAYTTAKETILMRGAKASFDKAVESSYKCILNPGTHLAHYKGNPQWFVGSALSDTNDQLSGVAKWAKSADVFKVPMGTQILNGAMNIAVIATQQYFLAEINRQYKEIGEKLQDIFDEVKRIREDIKDIKRSELMTASQELKEVMDHFDEIKTNPKRIDRECSRLTEIMRRALDTINLSKTKIDKGQDNVWDYPELIAFYRCAVYIYVCAKISYIQLENISWDEIEKYKAETESVCEDFFDYLKKCHEELSVEYAERCKAELEKAYEKNKKEIGKDKAWRVALWLLGAKLYYKEDYRAYSSEINKREQENTIDYVSKSVLNEIQAPEYVSKALKIEESKERLNNMVNWLDGLFKCIDSPKEYVCIDDKFFYREHEEPQYLVQESLTKA